jgi:hypothetical protein
MSSKATAVAASLSRYSSCTLTQQLKAPLAQHQHKQQQQLRRPLLAWKDLSILSRISSLLSQAADQGELVLCPQKMLSHQHQAIL